MTADIGVGPRLESVENLMLVTGSELRGNDFRRMQQKYVLPFCILAMQRIVVAKRDAEWRLSDPSDSVFQRARYERHLVTFGAIPYSTRH